MEYNGKLFEKVSNKYFDTGSTSDDFDNLQKKVAELKAQLKKISNEEIRESEANCFDPDSFLPCNVNEGGKCMLPTHCDYKQFVERT